MPHVRDGAIHLSERQRLLRRLAGQILALPTSGVLRVGIDGVDGAGKSVFGDGLANLLSAKFVRGWGRPGGLEVIARDATGEGMGAAWVRQSYSRRLVRRPTPV